MAMPKWVVEVAVPRLYIVEATTKAIAVNAAKLAALGAKPVLAHSVQQDRSFSSGAEVYNVETFEEYYGGEAPDSEHLLIL
jgi:hypothetical protein